MFEILGHLPFSIFNIKTIPLIRPLLDSPKSGLNYNSLLYSNSKDPDQTQFNKGLSFILQYPVIL